VDPRAGLDDVERKKFLAVLGLELRTLGRPARSHSLYRLRYPGCIHMYRNEVGTWDDKRNRHNKPVNEYIMEFNRQI
jgi:hypothetical protein